MKNLFIIFFLILVLAAPAGFVAAQVDNPAGSKTGNLDSAGIVNDQLCSGIDPTDPNYCSFDKLFGLDDSDQSLIGRVLDYAVFYLAVPLATIAIMWAGITMVSNTGNPGKQTAAKEMIQNAIIGLIIVLAAYLVIKVIVNSLADSEVIKLSISYLFSDII